MQINRFFLAMYGVVVLGGACAESDDSAADGFLMDAQTKDAEVSDVGEIDAVALPIAFARGVDHADDWAQTEERISLEGSDVERPEVAQSVREENDDARSATSATHASAVVPTRPSVEASEDGIVDVHGLPAISASGSIVAMRTWDDETGEDAVTFFRGRDGQVLHAYPLGREGVEGRKVARQLGRRLRREEFSSLVKLEPDPSTVFDAGYGAVFPVGELLFMQRANQLIARGARGLVGRTRVRPRRPDGNGVNLMDPEMVEMAVVAEMNFAYRSEDDHHLVAILSVCDCACDVNPYPLTVALAR